MRVKFTIDADLGLEGKEAPADIRAMLELFEASIVKRGTYKDITITGEYTVMVTETKTVVL